MVYEPIKLKGERVWRTYVGGREIGRLHGNMEAQDDHFPEEWMYSVTRAANSGREDIVEGLCKTDDGTERTLKDIIASDPVGMLGKEHVERWGNTPGVLIKIIDSKERLTLQVHPDKEKAEELFHSKFGKTECWHILGTREDMEEKPCIYLGFREGVTRELWEECFVEQDYDKMLSCMNRLEVKPGETYLVKGGIPHAIGSGCMIIEIQEPTDYTIRVEKVTPSGFTIDDRMCHQGLGFEKMFLCFHYEGTNEEEVRKNYCIPAKKQDNGDSELVGYEDTPCFCMEKMEIMGERTEKGNGVFNCLYVLSGEGILKTATAEYEINRNSQFFVPAQSEEYTISSQGSEPVVILKMYGPN